VELPLDSSSMVPQIQLVPRLSKFPPVGFRSWCTVLVSISNPVCLCRLVLLNSGLAFFLSMVVPLAEVAELSVSVVVHCLCTF